MQHLFCERKMLHDRKSLGNLLAQPELRMNLGSQMVVTHLGWVSIYCISLGDTLLYIASSLQTEA